jgi:subtilisin family serine protease
MMPQVKEHTISPVTELMLQVLLPHKNRFGVVGVAPNVDLYNVKVLAETNGGEGEWDWLENAIYAAVAGPDGIVGTDDDAEILNMSFGSGDEVPTQGVLDAVAWAYSLGVVMVAAAGNRGDGDASTTELNYPAALPEVIAVGASDFTGSVTAFSSSAPYLELIAPGDFILSTITGNSYALWSGTSMSAPHVSALAALVIAQYGSLPVGNFGDMGDNTIRGILHGMASDSGTAGWDPVYGYGIALYD